MNPPQVYMCSPSCTILPPPSPYYPSGSSQCWGLAALKCCVSFCCTTKWISHMYTYISSLLDLPPTPLRIPPFLVTTEHQAELPALLISFPLAIRLIHGSTHTSIPVYQFIPPVHLSSCPPVCSLCLRLYSCPANRFICSISFWEGSWL